MKQRLSSLNSKALTVGAALVVLLFAGVMAAHAAQPTPALSPTPTATLTKQQIEDRAQHAIATAQANPNKPAKLTATPDLSTPQPAPTPHAGIYDIHQGPFSSGEFIIRNQWIGQVGSVWLIVYAGAENTPISQSPGPGALRIYTATLNATGTTYDFEYVGLFPAPNNAAPLTITAVNGTLMQLQGDTGAAYTFDLQAKQFK